MADAKKLDVNAGLARVQTGLARARDDSDFLRVLAGALEPHGPQFIDLAYVYVDAAGAPSGLEVMRTWDGEVRERSPHYGHRVDLRDDDAAWGRLESTSEPLAFTRIADHPQLAAAQAVVGRSLASAVLIPLYSERHRAWQGLVGIYWTEPHTFTSEDLDEYEALARMVSEALGGERTLRALREALATNERLLAETRVALGETQAQRAMLRVMVDNLPLGVAVLHGATGARELENPIATEILGPLVPDPAKVAIIYAPGATEPLPREQWPIVRTLMYGETVSRELEMETPGEPRRLFALTTAPLRYPDDPAPRVINLFQDITEQRRTETERMAAQETLLRVQAAALAERSTPLIPISDDVLVMPIIGTIDGERARQILEALVHLNGAVQVRAAIVDITGVESLDTLAANTLIDAARALRLRGVEPILTGVRPGVASLLVSLGVDLSGITVCGTLQDGVTRASRTRIRGA
jgi:anti-anti-sigma regulatory factor/PAS domain-containing protein